MNAVVFDSVYLHALNDARDEYAALERKRDVLQQQLGQAMEDCRRVSLVINALEPLLDLPKTNFAPFYAEYFEWHKKMRRMKTVKMRRKRTQEAEEAVQERDR